MIELRDHAGSICGQLLHGTKLPDTNEREMSVLDEAADILNRINDNMSEE